MDVINVLILFTISKLKYKKKGQEQAKMDTRVIKTL